MIQLRRGIEFSDPETFSRANALETLFETYEPTKDDLQNTHIVIKSPHDSHLSTQMLLERVFTVDVEERLVPAEHYVSTSAIWNLEAEINSPGFALMNNCEQVSFNFESTTVKTRPADWLPWYSDMYRDSLRNCVRNSGRAFADRRVRGVGQNYDSIEDRLVTKQDFREEADTFAGANHPYYDAMKLFPVWDARVALHLIQAEGDFADNGDQFVTEQYTIGEGEDAVGVTVYDFDWTTALHNYSDHTKSNDESHALQISYNHEYLVQMQWDTREVPTNEELQQWQAHVIYGSQEANRPLSPQQQHDYDQSVALLDRWDEARPRYDVLRGAILRGYKEDWRDYPRSWVAARECLLDVDSVFLEAPWTIPENVNVPDVIQFDDNDWKARDAYASVLLTVIDGVPPFGPRPDGSTGLLQFYVDNQGLRREDEQLAQTIYDEFERRDYSKLKLHFVGNMRTGKRIECIHTILNKICKSDISLEELEEANDRATISARNAIKQLDIFENSQWMAVANHFRQLHMAVVEMKNFMDAEKAFDGAPLDIDDDGVYSLFTTEKPNSQAKISFVEPLAVGFCKPAKHLDVGCWGKAGEIIPRCKRMEIAFKWCANQEERLFNLFRMRNYRDAKRHGNVDFRLRIVDVSTKLHCTHYRGEIETPVKLGIPNIEAFQIGSVSFPVDHAADFTQSVRFDFQYRGNPEPKFVCFFTRRNWEPVSQTHSTQYKRTYHEGAAIKTLKLGIGTQINALRLDSENHRCRFSQLTAECFPEYKPPIDQRNTFFAFPYSKLYHSNFEPREGTRMFGEMTLEHEPYETYDRYKYEDRFDVMAMFIFDGKYLELGPNVQRSGLTLL